MNIFKKFLKTVLFEKDFKELEKEIDEKESYGKYMEFKNALLEELDGKVKKTSKRDICRVLVDLCQYKIDEYRKKLKIIKKSGPGDYWSLKQDILPKNRNGRIFTYNDAVDYFEERISTLSQRKKYGEKLLDGKEPSWDEIAEGRFREVWNRF